MKRILLVLLLVVLACGASAQGHRGKRKAKQAKEENLPVMSVFKAMQDEKFILYFGGKKINEEPATRVEVKGVNLNEPYNVRVVVKSPRVTANMNFRLITLSSQGEEYWVRRNVKRDNVEILSNEERLQLGDVTAKSVNIDSVIQLRRSLENLKAMAKDTSVKRQVIVVEPSSEVENFDGM